MSDADKVYRRADEMACDILEESADHPQLKPFLVVMERSDFNRMMISKSAPMRVSMNYREFTYPYSGWWICSLPIRVEPDGSWKVKSIKPYPLVMTHLQAQMNFGGEYN